MNFRAFAGQSLSVLIGLPLSAAYSQAAMKSFHFGPLRPHPTPGAKGIVGAYALHVQCPWRIVTRDRIVTGKMDLFEPVVPRNDFDWQKTIREPEGNLQHKILHDLLHPSDPATRSEVEGNDQLAVVGVEVDVYGGIDLNLSNHYRLQCVPCGTRVEDWRLFKPGDTSRHFVVGEGKILES